MSDDEHATRVEFRYKGRLYAASALPNGSTNIERDGIWFCNADWNGRALYTGDNELHPDLDESNVILEALADALKASGATLMQRKRDL